jgi:hypothetical protein
MLNGMGLIDGDHPDWDEIHDFGSPGEYQRFLLWLSKALTESQLVEIPVGTHYLSTAFEERWFRSPSGAVWRVVAPDFPFRGVFALVAGSAAAPRCGRPGFADPGRPT